MQGGGGEAPGGAGQGLAEVGPCSRQITARLASWLADWQGGASVLVAGVLGSCMEELYMTGFFVWGLGTLVIMNITNN